MIAKTWTFTALFWLLGSNTKETFCLSLTSGKFASLTSLQSLEDSNSLEDTSSTWQDNSLEYTDPTWQENPLEVTGPACPLAFQQIGGRCYFYGYFKLNWFRAAEFCHSFGEGVALACIETRKENQHLKKWLGKHGDHSTGVWLGGSDNGHNDRWAWFPTGQLISWFDWGPGQPSRKDQHCMYLVGGFLGYQWADFHCGFEMTFMCEHRVNDAPLNDPRSRLLPQYSKNQKDNSWELQLNRTAVSKPISVFKPTAVFRPETNPDKLSSKMQYRYPLKSVSLNSQDVENRENDGNKPLKQTIIEVFPHIYNEKNAIDRSSEEIDKDYYLDEEVENSDEDDDTSGDVEKKDTDLDTDDEVDKEDTDDDDVEQGDTNDETWSIFTMIRNMIRIPHIFTLLGKAKN